MVCAQNDHFSVSIFDTSLSLSLSLSPPPSFLPPSFIGLAGADVKALGIPTEEEFVALYSELTGVKDLSQNWNFYMAFTFFRVAAILQGVYKRSLQSKLCLQGKE